VAGVPKLIRARTKDGAIMLNDGNALVLFSGGQDSTTCLAWALDRFERVETIGFDYCQRHRVELEVRPLILEGLRTGFPDWAGRLGEDHLLDMKVLGDISETALTRDVGIAIRGDGLPNTFVPGRNLIFLAFAAALAYRRGARHLVTGVCETDYSGYPDCRDDTIKAMQVALNLGMEASFALHTPLMWVDKAGTWRMAHDLGGERLVALVRDETHSCYEGDRDHRHGWGHGCGACPACDLRARGYEDYARSAAS
jgi:7-cyano-7-deazaguanine synthase